jgi:hypothetical protein
VPFIVISIDALIEAGVATYGRCHDAGVITIYRGSFEVSYRGSVDAAPPIVTAQALLSEYSRKASHVLLHELYHAKQFADEKHHVLTTVQIEAEATEFTSANEGLWDDLVELTDTPSSAPVHGVLKRT